ncbi:FecR family protein [Pseudanabaena mucicola]|uniref:FecR domain-containing protein n=1 Tax=Pseudanabaena mucicola FACHB-723 TaxID=2692860 RepID=A0ABR8A0S8_9CYAN|nr:FecR family protein [Pseudanabaena mucicola]MBD2189772.1 FecR domain-containing protein [Pseudanabaena mucicola FACHB-723]
MKTSLLISVVAIALFSCESQPTPSPSAPSASVAIATPQPKAIQEKAIAKVSLVEEKPVSVISKKDNKETDASLGMGLYVADIVRTQGKGKAQIEFDNGVGLRIGGNSVVQIKPNNRLNLTEGEMLTWVKPGLKVPTEISTAYASATIRGTTVYVEIPKDLNKGIRFFSWEGTVVVKLANQPKEIILLTGEEIIVTPNSTNLPVVRRMDLNEWEEISKTSSLLRSFASPLPTQKIIDNLVPGQASLDQTPPARQPKVENSQESQDNQDNLDSPKDADDRDRDDDDIDDDDKDDDMDDDDDD